MTPVRIHGDFGAILGEALEQLRAVPLIGAILIVSGWLSLAFGVERWLLSLVTLGWPSLAVGSALFLLLTGAVLLLHASQLLLAPGAVVPHPPTLASRARRLARVAGVEIAVVAVATLALAALDRASGAALAHAITDHLVWRGEWAGLSAPGLAWLVAWAGYCLLHAPTLSWLWPALAANYPGGTLKATLTLATSAGRLTPWLTVGVPGLALTLVGLTAFGQAGIAILALIPLLVWPALANTAAARVRPDD